MGRRRRKRKSSQQSYTEKEHDVVDTDSVSDGGNGKESAGSGKVAERKPPDYTDKQVDDAAALLNWCLCATRPMIVEWITKQLGETLVQKWGAYWVWEGQHPLGLVAHIDTVPEMRLKGGSPKVLITPDGTLFADDKTGLGADDRAGICAIIRAIVAGYRPWVIICDEEERGCLGAKALASDHPGIGKGMVALVEVDRRGHNDVVYYDMDTDAADSAVLREVIEKQVGFEKAIGSCSDISKLAPAFDLAACNISAGYYGEHGPSECLKVREWLFNSDRLHEILDKTRNMRRLSYTHKSYSYSGGYSRSGYSGYTWGDWDDRLPTGLAARSWNPPQERGSHLADGEISRCGEYIWRKNDKSTCGGYWSFFTQQTPSSVVHMERSAAARKAGRSGHAKEKDRTNPRWLDSGEKEGWGYCRGCSFYTAISKHEKFDIKMCEDCLAAKWEWRKGKLICTEWPTDKFHPTNTINAIAGSEEDPIVECTWCCDYILLSQAEFVESWQGKKSPACPDCKTEFDRLFKDDGKYDEDGSEEEVRVRV